jgi:hypothetical protein
MNVEELLVLMEARLLGKVGHVSQSVNSLHEKVEIIMTSLANLQAAVAAETTVEQSVVTLLTTLSADLQAAIAAGDPAAIQAVADQITKNTTVLSNAVVANTPVATGSFAVGGVMAGLAAGQSVVLLDNGSDSLTVSANGPFAFITKLASGAAYAVTVQTQPTDGTNCTIAAGNGTVAAADITSVLATCA